VLLAGAVLLAVLLAGGSSRAMLASAGLSCFCVSTEVMSNVAEDHLLRRLLASNTRHLHTIPAAHHTGEVLHVEIRLALKKIVRLVIYMLLFR